MSIYNKIYEIVDKYRDKELECTLWTRKDENGNIKTIDNEIEDCLYDEDVYDIRVNFIKIMEDATKIGYALSWCGSIEGEIKHDLIAVYEYKQEK